MFAVAPHAGAWIEILIITQMIMAQIVAPHAGAWIEIFFTTENQMIVCRRSPCGSVD